MNDNQTHEYQKDEESTMINQTSYITISPIHSASQSFLTMPKLNKVKPKPAFGTNASREQKMFNIIKNSNIVGWPSVNNHSFNRLYFQQAKIKAVPFMTSTNRFQAFNIKSPGPGSYSHETKQSAQQVQTKYGAMYCPFKKLDNLYNENNKKQSNKSQYKTQFPAPNTYYIDKNNINKYEIQQKIRLKQQQNRQKLLKQRQIVKKSYPIPYKPLGQQKNEKQLKQNQQKQIKSPSKKKNIQKANVFNFAETTKNQFPKIEYNFQRKSYRLNDLMNSSRKGYHPIFLSKNQKLFCSYIPKDVTLEPGQYQQKSKKIQRKTQSKVLSYIS